MDKEVEKLLGKTGMGALKTCHSGSILHILFSVICLNQN